MDPVGSLDEDQVGLEGVRARPAAATYDGRGFDRCRASEAARDPAGIELTLGPVVGPAGDGQLHGAKGEAESMVGTVADHGELGAAGERLLRDGLLDGEADRAVRPLMGRDDDGKGESRGAR